MDPGISRFDLNLFVEEKEERLRISVEYNAELFYPAPIDRLIGCYQTLLEALLTDPDRRIAELPMSANVEEGHGSQLSDVELDRLLSETEAMTESEAQRWLAEKNNS